MRLFCSIFNHGHAIRQSGGQHDVHGGAHRDLVQKDVGALDPSAGGLRHNEAALGIHLHPQGAEALQVLVNGARAAEVAPAGQGHVRRAEAAQQCTQHVVGGPAAAGALVGNPPVAEAGAVNFHGVWVEKAHSCA